MELEELGWDNFFLEDIEELENNKIVGRVCKHSKNSYGVYSQFGELKALLSGKYEFNIETNSDYPAIGDWVLVEKFADDEAIIHDLLPRKSVFSRKKKQTNIDEQIIATNIDFLFIVMGLDKDYNLRRLERYLLQQKDKNIKTVIILNKVDLCDNSEEIIDEIKKVNSEVDCHFVSAINNTGISDLEQYLIRGKTIAFIGSSGVGKSTIVNKIIGDDIRDTGEIRIDDSKGKHTTTSRDMILLKSGAILIDNPGIRSIQLFLDDINELNDNFSDIESLSFNCKFNNCEHQNEPKCAVNESINKGELDIKRLKNYLKMRQEINHLSNKKKKLSKNSKSNKSRTLLIKKTQKDKKKWTNSY